MHEIPERMIREGTPNAPEEEGIIIGMAKNLVRVRIMRGAACATCAIAQKCNLSSETKREWQVWAKNDIGAKEGDRVKVAIAPSRYILIAALIFIVPVAVLIATYLIMKSFGVQENLSVAFAVMGAILFYLVVRSVDKRFSSAGNYKIIEIIHHSEG